MPSRMVKNLQQQCLESIIVNFRRHCFIYREECKGGENTITSYELLHQKYTEVMFKMLRQKEITPDSICPTSSTRYIRFVFNGDNRELDEADYLAFLLNRHTKVLDLSKVFICYSNTGKCKILRPLKFTRAVLLTVQTITKNLSVVNLHHCDADEDDLLLLLKAIPKVLCLDLSHTACSDDHIDIIRKFCPLLKNLNISNTEVTNDGMKYLSANDSRSNESVCKIASINIKSTSITFQGMQMIIESLVFLKELQYFAYDDTLLYLFRGRYKRFLSREKNYETVLHKIPTSLLFGGVPKILYDMNKQTLSENDSLNVRKCALTELLFGTHEADEEILQFVPTCCPEVRSVVIDCAISPEYLLFCTNFSHLIKVRLFLNNPVPLSQLLELFTVQGHKLKAVALYGEMETDITEYRNLLRWLELCPQLEEFSLGCMVLKTEMFRHNIRSFRESLKCRCLSAQLKKITLENLSGSGLTEFLLNLLPSTPHVNILTIVSLSHGVDEAMQAAFATHGFQNLRRSRILGSNADLLPNQE